MTRTPYISKYSTVYMTTNMADNHTAQVAIALAHNLLIVALATLGGVALSLRYWVMPAIMSLDSAPDQRAPDAITSTHERRASRKTSALMQIKQFNQVIDLGFRYLQTSSRMLPVVIIGLAAATYRYNGSITSSSSSSNAVDATQAGAIKLASELELIQNWTHYVLALLPLVLLGPWEAYLIFPSNDRIAEIGRELERSDDKAVGGEIDVDARADEIQRLFESWQFWHVGRIVGPYIAVGVLAASGAGMLQRVRL